jgi:hypothetical protein
MTARRAHRCARAQRTRTPSLLASLPALPLLRPPKQGGGGAGAVPASFIFSRPAPNARGSGDAVALDRLAGRLPVRAAARTAAAPPPQAAAALACTLAAVDRRRRPAYRMRPPSPPTHLCTPQIRGRRRRGGGGGGGRRGRLWGGRQHCRRRAARRALTRRPPLPKPRPLRGAVRGRRAARLRRLRLGRRRHVRAGAGAARRRA